MSQIDEDDAEIHETILSKLDDLSERVDRSTLRHEINSIANDVKAMREREKNVIQNLNRHMENQRVRIDQYNDRYNARVQQLEAMVHRMKDQLIKEHLIEE